MEIVIGVAVFVGIYWAGNRYLAHRAARRNMKRRLASLVYEQPAARPAPQLYRNRLGED